MSKSAHSPTFARDSGYPRRKDRRWRYDYDWLVAKFRDGWSCMDISHFDNCAPGTVEYHLEQAGVEVDSWGSLCTRFKAEREYDRRDDEWMRSDERTTVETSQAGLEDFV